MNQRNRGFLLSAERHYLESREESAGSENKKNGVVGYEAL